MLFLGWFLIGFVIGKVTRALAEVLGLPFEAAVIWAFVNLALVLVFFKARIDEFLKGL